MYSNEELRKIDNRDNKGIRDIISTEESVNGVFEMDGKFANGYHIFIPYGISVDLSNALEIGVRTIMTEIDEQKKLIREIQEQENQEPLKLLKETAEHLIGKYESHVKVLNALDELVASI